MYALIGAARLNDVDPRAWTPDVLGDIAETPQDRPDELPPWNYEPASQRDLKPKLQPSPPARRQNTALPAGRPPRVLAVFASIAL